MELNSLMHKLKMEYLPGNLDALCEQAARRELDYRSFLTEALATEKGLENRLRQARCPGSRPWSSSHFSFQPSIDRKVVRELAGGLLTNGRRTSSCWGRRAWARPTWPSPWESRQPRQDTVCCS